MGSEGEVTPTTENLRAFLIAYFKENGFDITEPTIRDHEFEIDLEPYMNENDMKTLRATNIKCTGIEILAGYQTPSNITVHNKFDQGRSSRYLTHDSIAKYRSELPTIFNLSILRKIAKEPDRDTI